MPKTDSATPIALVVEDDALIRMAAVDIVETAGFRALEAGSADEAMPLLEENDGAITLLFTDVEMPGSMTGFDLAQRVAKRWPYVGILVASGRRRPGPDDLPAGATFIEKPFSADVVQARLKDILPDGKRPDLLKGR